MRERNGRGLPRRRVPLYGIDRAPAPPVPRTSIDPDALIIIGVQGTPGIETISPDAPIKTVTVVPGFYAKPLHERASRDTIDQISRSHKEGAEQSGATHHMTMTTQSLERVLSGDARTPEEKGLLKQVKEGKVNFNLPKPTPRTTF